MPQAVANALGLRLGSDVEPAEAVARAIGTKQLLLVLDNCEHLVDAAAALAAMIVCRCPRATILATSRELLRIDGEYAYGVAALDVPTNEHTAADQILGHSAPELFIARANELGADFSLQAESLPTIAAICRHLDGIPLAIEFAAAGAATLGLTQVAAALRDRFTLMKSGTPRAAPAASHASCDARLELPTVVRA